MKVSVDWLKQYIPNELDVNDLSVLLTGVGLEVEGIEEAESVKGGLKGIVVGEVMTCEKHPDADRLSLTTVNIGGESNLQIVCGAPNVAKNQKVLVATVGATLYPTEGESFTIKKGKIRGQESNGMICALDELGLGSDHSGIIVLENEAIVGTPAAKHLNLSNDYILEVNLTPNRSDATAHFGVARDIFAALKINHGYNGSLVFPEINETISFSGNCPIKVKIADNQACPRYSGLYFENIEVKDSPDWLKKRLLSIGVRPINNVVDITNFVLHELGQPLHAFDASKIADNQVIVEFLKKDTIFKTLDDQERKLNATDLMICDGKNQPMCIAGVFGGSNSGVNEKTTSIFLESAHFDAKTIRRTSMAHGLRTDAAKCFEKGSDPNITIIALQRAALLLEKFANATIVGNGIDIYPNPVLRKELVVNISRIQKLIGADISASTIIDILEALDIQVIEKLDNQIKLSIPTNKVDVYREADIVEEVLRIYGFDNVPVDNSIKSAVVKSEIPDNFYLKNRVSDFLIANSFREMMGISLTQSKYFTDIIPIDANQLVFINNTSNVSTNIMRPTLLSSGLEAILHNQNRQQSDLKLFEFGKAYYKLDEKYKEEEFLTLLMIGQLQNESWLNRDKESVGFYAIKDLTHKIFGLLGVQLTQVSKIEESAIFSIGNKIHRGTQVLAEYGLVQPKISKGFEIKQEVWFANIHWSSLIKSTKNNTTEFEEISKYPAVRRDLALVLDSSITFEKIKTIAQKQFKKLLKEINLFDVYENENQLGKGKKSYAVSFVFEDSEKTLNDKEIEKHMQTITSSFEQQLGAIVRK